MNFLRLKIPFYWSFTSPSKTKSTSKNAHSCSQIFRNTF